MLWNRVTGRVWKNFEKRDRKSLDCREQTVGRNMDVKACARKDFEEVRDTAEKAYVIAENGHVVVNRSWIKTRVLKVLLKVQRKRGTCY